MGRKKTHLEEPEEHKMSLTEFGNELVNQYGKKARLLVLDEHISNEEYEDTAEGLASSLRDLQQGSCPEDWNIDADYYVFTTKGVLDRYGNMCFQLLSEGDGV